MVVFQNLYIPIKILLEIIRLFKLRQYNLETAMKKTLEISIVILLSIITAIIAFFSMRFGRYVSLVIFGMDFVPIFIAYIFKINLKKMLPDIIFGIIDHPSHNRFPSFLVLSEL